MNISLAIVDANREYLNRMVDVLQEYDDLTVSAFTSIDKLEKTLENRRFDVVLYDPDVSDSKVSFPNAKMSVCLYSDDAQNAMLYSDSDKVLKYQRISKIYKEILKLFAEHAGNVVGFSNNSMAKIIAVYSPIGGSGKTTISLALASKMIAGGKSVFLLNMEQLNSSACYNPNVEEGITQLIEGIGEGTNFELKLKGIMKSGINGVSYVEGFERAVDYNTITKDEIESVIEKIRVSCQCDVVLIDMNSMIDGISQMIFEQADKIVVVETSGDLEEQKMMLFSQQAITCQNLDKMCKVENFKDGAGSQGRLDVPGIGYIRDYGRRAATKNVIQAIYTNEDLNVSFLVK